MRQIKIDRLPPEPTGNTKQDVEATEKYLFYLYERLNYIIDQLSKGDISNGN